MASRKRISRPKTAETKVSEQVEKAESVVRTVAERAFDLAEKVSETVDKTADRVISTAEDITGIEGKSARKVYQTISDARNRGIATAKQQTKKLISSVSEIVSNVGK